MTLEDFFWLTELHLGDPITEVVSGGAWGADHGGEMWAQEHGIPVKTFFANWSGLGNKAGPIRNRQMAEYLAANPPGVVLLFPGGRGTASMKSIAIELGLTVKEAHHG